MVLVVTVITISGSNSVSIHFDDRSFIKSPGFAGCCSAAGFNADGLRVWKTVVVSFSLPTLVLAKLSSGPAEGADRAH